ncbi:hypothetical protein BJ875DRAFT_152680 [Amylocarpus encephaloides]|uniref:Rhodopsin domain-containing protein n=1 Tax=Amylocarpus encephaloides TaxID=45428 RepID=A0A9P7YP79_9HELO|nr:hypothetical protein BJ875DRAFT_152680 [Amylocarpus encephaloides]
MGTMRTPESMGAPPGTKPNYIDPVNQTTTLIALHTVCLTVVTISVSLRLYTRKFIVNSLGVDDYLCMAAWCLAVAYSGVNLYADSRGFGRHLWDIYPDRSHTVAVYRPFAIGIWIYIILAATIKLACLFFYRTIFKTSRKTILFVNGGIVGVAAIYTVMLCLQVFQCKPIPRTWDKRLDGTCRSGKITAYSSGVVNAVTDIYVLTVPIPAVWALPLRKWKKIRVISVFCLGLAACATSIVRLVEFPYLYRTKDTTWWLTKVSVWSLIEIHTGFTVACLLVLPAFLKRHWPKGLNRRIAHSLPFSRSTEDSYATNSVSRGPKRNIYIQEYALSTRSDQINLTTRSSIDQTERRNDNEPLRFNTTRPLSPTKQIPTGNEGPLTFSASIPLSPPRPIFSRGEQPPNYEAYLSNNDSDT